MIFSSARFSVTVGAVAAAWCAALYPTSPSNVSHVQVVPAAAAECSAEASGRIAYDGQTGVLSSRDADDRLQYTYTRTGFSFRPDGADAAWDVALTLQGIRRDDAVLESRTEPSVSLNNTELHVHAGSYTVEYTHTAEGVRQNFYVREQLPGDGPLTVELACETDLRMCLAGEDDLLFLPEDGGAPVAWYRDLHVWDASGRVLESHMELADNTVRLVVDDHNALYPVTVDPVVGSNWAVLGGQIGERYGWSVAGGMDINGDGYEDMVIGSPLYDRAGQTDVGCLTVYLGTSTDMGTTASCTIYGAQEGARFGWSVASAGDVNNDGYDDIIVGAPLHDNTGASLLNNGKVFVFHGSSAGLSTVASWSAEANTSSAEFGTSVAGAGDVDNDGYDDVIVGAPGYSNGQSNEGRAYVFHGSSSGLSSSAEWLVESNQADARFGASVAGAGDVDNDGYGDVIVGAPKYSNGQDCEGRAYVFHGSSNGLNSSPEWTAESDQASAEFGTSVAGVGDVNNDGYDDVVVGAPKYDHGQTDEGKIYLYTGSGSGVSSAAVWTAESNQAYAGLGTTVAGAGDINNDNYDDIMTGAPGYDGFLKVDAGLVVIYGGNSSSTPSTSSLIEGEHAYDQLGQALSRAGTVNNNSTADVIVAAPVFSSVVSNGGKTYILRDPELIYTKRGAGLPGGVVDLLAAASLYPNPVSTGAATVQFELRTSAAVEIEVVDCSGLVVHQTHAGTLSTGHHTVSLVLADLAAGAYIVRITAGTFVISTPLRIVR